MTGSPSDAHVPDEEPVPPVYGTADSAGTGEAARTGADGARGSGGHGRGTSPPHNGLAIVGLVCSIVAIAVSWLPLVNVVSIVLGAAAIVFAVIAFRRPGQHKIALAGMIIGIMSCVIALLVLLIFGWFLTTVT